MNSTDVKNELLSYIDNLSISKEDYDILLNLLNNFDDCLFVKIIEELKDKQLTLSDFISLLDGKYNFSDNLEKTINDQEKLYTDYSQLFNYLSELKILNSGSMLDYFITADKNAIDIEKKRIIEGILKDESDDPYEEYFKTSLLTNILNNDTDIGTEDFLLSVHDFIVPVDFNYIQLTEYDKKFMRDNGLTEDEMKKTKSIAALNTTLIK